MSSQFFPFPNTHWSLVHRAGVTDEVSRGEALAVLLERYQPALLSYLQRVLKLSEGMIDDVLQAFLADKLLQQRFLQHADERRGRFRTFLLTSLNHYVTSWSRSAKSQRTLPLNVDRDFADPAAPAPYAIVEANWARVLILNVLQVMREECLKDSRSHVWAVFEGRLLAEIFDDREPVPYEKLAADLKLGSPTQAANLLVTGKRMYVRLLRQAVGEYESEEAVIDEEILELRAILGRGISGEIG